jgi:hypothetical protein
MEKNGIKSLYPGHYFGKNAETKQRIDDMATMSRDVLAGKVKGAPGGRGTMGLDLASTTRRRCAACAWPAVRIAACCVGI